MPQIKHVHEKMLTDLLFRFHQDTVTKDKAATLLLTKFRYLFENAPQNDEHLCNAIPIFLGAFLGLSHSSLAVLLAKSFGDEFDINLLTINGFSLLHCACFGGHNDLVETLISKYGLDYTLLDNSGLSILHYAVTGSNLDTITLLTTKYKLDLEVKDWFGSSSLCLAVEVGQLDVVRTLIENFKCNPQVKGAEGCTLLHYACKGGVSSVLIDKLVDKYHLDPTDQDNNGQTPLHIAIIFAQLKTVRHLLTKYKLCSKILKKFRYVNLAAYYGYIEVLRMLIDEFDCDPSEKKSSGYTLLHSACLKGHTDVADELLSRYTVDPMPSDNLHNMPLHYAAQNGHLEVMKLLLTKYKVKADVPGSNGYTPLVHAVTGGHANVVQLLIVDCKCVHQIEDFSGNTLIHFACKYGQTKMIEELISKYRESPVAKNSLGQTPLHTAVMCGHVEAIRYLICTQNVDIYPESTDGFTPVQLAALKGHLSVVKMFIDDFKCDPFSKHLSGCTLVHFACVSGNIELISDLINTYHLSPATKSTADRTPLHVAAFRGHASVVKYLISEHKLSQTDRDKAGLSAVCLATLGGHVNVVRTLIDQFECDAQAKGVGGCTILHYACQKGHTKLADELIIKYKVNPMATDDGKETPLHKAAMKGHLEVMQLLITKHKVKVDALTKDDVTPLMLAAYSGHIDAVRSLINDYKSDHQLRNQRGLTLIHMAASVGGHIEVVQELVTKYHMDLSLKDKLGNTPLHTAARYGQTETVKYLISKHAADIDARNNDNSSPLHIAALWGHYDTVLLLLNNFNCNPHTKCIREQSLLHCACQSGHIKLISDLISIYKLDPKAKDLDGAAPAHIAAIVGKIEVLRYLINECGVETESQTNYGDTPLLLAARNGHHEVIMALIQEFNCDMGAKSFQGYTVLHGACFSGNLMLVERLVTDYHLSPTVKATDSKRFTPLHCAVLNGHLHILRYFVSGCKIDICEFAFSLLFEAALKGLFDVAKALIEEFKIDPHVRSFESRFTLLHAYALYGGNADVIDTLIADYHLDIMARDANNLTPLDIAAAYGRANIVRHFMTCYKKTIGPGASVSLCIATTRGCREVIYMLIEEFGCSLQTEDYTSRTLTHFACYGSQKELLRELVAKYSLQEALKIKDKFGNSLIHVAAAKGHVDILVTLITEYQLEADVSNDEGVTPLLLAAAFEHWDVVQVLIKQFKYNVNATNNHRQTLLHYSCEYNKTSLTDNLIDQYHLNPLAEDEDGNTPLHLAAIRGHFNMIKHLTTVHRVDVSNMYFTLICLAAIEGHTEAVIYLMTSAELHPDRSMMKIQDNTLLHMYAHEGSKTAIADQLIQRGISPKAVNEHGNTPLHIASSSGCIKLVRHFINYYKVDVCSPNNAGHTLLHLAAMNRHQDIVQALIKEFGCSPHITSPQDATLLHFACQADNKDLVCELITEYSLDPSKQDVDGNTALHIAAQYGCKDVFAYLARRIQEKPLIHCRNAFGWSLLHMACFGGNPDLVEILIKEHKLSLLCVDHEDNTPLHVAAMRGNANCVKTLLEYNAPICLENSTGHTCDKVQVEKNDPEHVTVLFKKYTKEKGAQVQALYGDILKLSEKEKFTKVVSIFVLGHPGGGKTTLIDTLRRIVETNTGWGLPRRSEVEPHTAGIVPNVVDSETCGRLLIYDFAGDKEYYSSHAAILHKYESQDSNLYIVVLDLTIEASQLKYRFGYWLHFLSTFQESVCILPVCSHFDCFSGDSISEAVKKVSLITKTASEFLQQHVTGMHVLDPGLIDCRSKEQVARSVQDVVQKISTRSPSSKLSLEAKLLIGLLRKKFSSAVACTVGKIVDLVCEHCIPLPQDPATIYPVLKELYHTGYLLLVDRGKETLRYNIVILQIDKVTEDLHKKLFSASAKKEIASKIGLKFSAGLIPESLLPKILPKHITKECLVHLQYCQELKGVELTQDFTLTRSQHASPTDESLLFFPALCNTKMCEKEAFWEPAKHAFGWYARCENEFEYFPIRFLHVLLVRIVHRLPAQQDIEPGVYC